MGNRYYRFPKALKTFTSSSNVLQMAEAKSAIRKPVFNKVDQLRPGTGGHNLILKVVSSKTVLQKGRPDGPQGKVSIKFVEFNSWLSFYALDLMKPDGTVILCNAKIDMFKGSMRLAVDKWGRVEVTEPASFTVKDDNNLSLLKLKEIVKVENKEHGKASAAASLAGALLGALALLADYIDTEDSSVRIGAIMGLGHAYAGAQNEQIRSKLTPILGDNKVPLDVIAFTAISLALVYVGSCNEEVAQAIIFALMDRSESELGEPLTRLLPLGLGLLFLGKQSVEATTEVSKTFNEKIRKYYDMTLLSCAYAGTGNVLKVQHLLGQCAQHLEKGETHQGPAILGIAMVAMAEELGLEMAIRSLEHLLQYGEQNIRRAIPLALGLLCISNPKVNVMDTLNRLSHDTDTEVAMAGVISLGLIGAGTNNARIAGMLRNLSSYYYKEASLLFCVRIAQGLVHLGKGLLTLAPYHSERFLLSPFNNGRLLPKTALAGIVTLLHACLDMKAIILGKYHYVLYFLVLAMQPRMLLTVDENLKPLSVPVRVGQAVDVVGQAGRPKTITGFQTHSTPVLLAAGDRAELATEKSTPLKLDLLPTEARISGKEYKERVVNNLKILIVHYSDVHQSHSKAVKRAISEHCA
ncbi:unnamed protein product [Camellia sinensis]